VHFILGHVPYTSMEIRPTWSQGQKNVGPILSIFGLQIGPELLIDVRTFRSKY